MHVQKLTRGFMFLLEVHVFAVGGSDFGDRSRPVGDTVFVGEFGE